MYPRIVLSPFKIALGSVVIGSLIAAFSANVPTDFLPLSPNVNPVPQSTLLPVISFRAPIPTIPTPSASIVGHVSGPDGEPLSSLDQEDVRVEVINRSVWLRYGSSIDFNGYFTFPVSAGLNEVLVSVLDPHMIFR